MKITNHFEENGRTLEDILEQFLLRICLDWTAWNL
jgi:hypothetical protein